MNNSIHLVPNLSLLTWVLSIVLLTHTSCSEAPDDGETPVGALKPQMNLAYVKVDTFFTSQRLFDLVLTDSTGHYNPVFADQYLTIHSLQSTFDPDQFDTLRLTVHMPNRSGGGYGLEFSSERYRTAAAGFSNQIFKDLIRDFLALDMATAYKYRERKTSLIDRTNMIFGHEIDDHFKDEFPDNSIWFGYSSFRIFGLYIEECYSGKQGVAHELVRSIRGKTKYLLEEDIESLLLLLGSYEKRVGK